MRAKLVAEAVGTFVLVFAGTGAIAIDVATDGALTQVGIALTFGLAVMAMIHVFGAISGAHINPAVTLGFWASGRFPLRQAIPYVASQCIGAIVASLLLRLLFPGDPTLGGTSPSGSVLQSFVLEVVLTLILMFVILTVATGAREQGLLAAAAIGAVVGIAALFGGPISGASMNPARSLGPALVGLRFDALWIYLCAPVLGALCAVPLCRLMRRGPCCARAPAAGPGPG